MRRAPVRVPPGLASFPNTTGLRSADFRICDAHRTDPVGMTERLGGAEKLLRLPDSQWCYAPVFERGCHSTTRRG